MFNLMAGNKNFPSRLTVASLLSYRLISVPELSLNDILELLSLDGANQSVDLRSRDLQKLFAD